MSRAWQHLSAMGQPDLISRSRADKKRPHRLRGLLSSFVFHALLICFIFELTMLQRARLPLPDKGSAPGAPIIALETMIIVTPPAPPAPPSPTLRITPLTAIRPVPSAPAMVSHPAPQPLPPEPQTMPHPETGVPVLAGQTTKPVPATPEQTGAPVRLKADLAATGGGMAHLRPTGANFISSYAPGPSVLPHPPYPPEARDLQQTGIVRMLVQFDRAGNVDRADVAQSSGVAILDSATRSFIRANWHSTTYAGKAISVPVEYTLTSL